MDKNSLEMLYKWIVIKKDESSDSNKIFIEEEKLLDRYNIKTRVSKIESGGYELLVPLKWEEISRGLINGSIKSIYDKASDHYHVFDEDLTYKNKGLYEKPYTISKNNMKTRRYMYLGFVILALLMFLKFVEF